MAEIEIGRLAPIAEKACTAVIDDPSDIAARRSLFDVLGPIVNPIFIDHNDLPPYLHASWARCPGATAPCLNLTARTSRSGPGKFSKRRIK